MSRPMLRSLLAIAAGVITIGVFAFFNEALVRWWSPGEFDAKGFTTSGHALGMMVVHTAFASVIAGWLTAKISRRADMRNVLILAGIQLVATLCANAMLYDRRLLSFYAAALVFEIAGILAGGWIHVRRSATLAT